MLWAREAGVRRDCARRVSDCACAWPACGVAGIRAHGARGKGGRNADRLHTRQQALLARVVPWGCSAGALRTATPHARAAAPRARRQRAPERCARQINTSPVLPSSRLAPCAQLVDRINRTRENPGYLPGIKAPDGVTATTDILKARRRPPAASEAARALALQRGAVICKLDHRIGLKRARNTPSPPPALSPRRRWTPTLCCWRCRRHTSRLCWVGGSMRGTLR